MTKTPADEDLALAGLARKDDCAGRLKIAGSRYRQARERMEIERQGLHDEIREAAGTMSEAEIARVTGVQRETVRKALGK